MPISEIHWGIRAGNILLTGLGIDKLANFGVAKRLVDTWAKRNTVAETPF